MRRAPHWPFVETCRALPLVAAGGGDDTVEEEGAALNPGSTQYLVPATSAAHEETDGLARRNCETVMPASEEMVAHVSPVRAVMMTVQGSAARAIPHAEARRRRGRRIFWGRVLGAIDLGHGVVEGKRLTGLGWRGEGKACMLWG